MTEVNDAFTAEAVQWWLEKEAANSTFNANSSLDDLDGMRQSLVDGQDPKIGGHISRMQLWLGDYDDDRFEYLSTDEKEATVSRVAFGALMFLSGNYRRQRILQSTDRDDYFRRKLEWVYPHGIDIKDFISERLRQDRQSGVSCEDVKNQGHQSLKTTEEALEVIYANVPRDFGLELSSSVLAIRQEEHNWLTFLSKVLTHGSTSLGIPIESVPILEPKTITEAKPTTLEELMKTKQTNPNEHTRLSSKKQKIVWSPTD